jgi:hypothetical protein
VATLVWNNSGGALPIPGIYGGGFIHTNSGKVVNDTIASAISRFGILPNDSVYLSAVPDGQTGALTVGALVDEFASTEQTGTGSAQNIPHGMGVVPKAVFCIPTDTSPATAGVFTVTEGAHDATNCVVTVTAGKKFKVLAISP